MRARILIAITLLNCFAVLSSCSPSPEDELYAQAVQQEGRGAFPDARAKYVEVTQRYPTSPQARMALERIAALDAQAAARRASTDHEFETVETQDLLRKQLEAQRVQKRWNVKNTISVFCLPPTNNLQ